MNSDKLHADCMSCSHELSNDFIEQVTPRKFHNQEYRQKRAEDLLSQERSLLPDTQHLLEKASMKVKYNKEIDELKKEEIYLKHRIQEIRASIRRLRKIISEETEEHKDTEERKKFTMSCPNGECRGFLSQAWKCGTCDKYTCSRCRMVKNERNDYEHKCDEDAVKTYELLKTDTKPCPKCAVPIFYINGCDQMFCTQCHTPFSWKTGRIVTGVIHNPHYYQWQREMNGGIAPRVAGDIVGRCGDMPLPAIVQLILLERKHQFNNLEECHRLVGHLRDVVIPNFPIRNRIQDNTDLRLRYLKNEIDTKRWLSILKMRQKKSEKNRDVNQILEMFITSLTDLFMTYVTGHTNNLEKDVCALRSYVNKELLKIGTRYENKVPYVTDNWQCK